MKKIRIIKKNRKAHYMLVATFLSAFVLTLFGLLMLFSPLVNYFDEANQITIFTALRNFYTREFLSDEVITENNLVVWKIIPIIKKDWSFIAYNSDLKSIVFLPTKFTMIWLPIIVGGIGILAVSCRWALHEIGYKPKGKKGIYQIIKPVRSYSWTIFTCWVVLILIFFTTLLTALIASPFSTGGFVTISLKGDLTVDAGDITTSFNNIEQYLVDTGVHTKYFWLTMVLFNKSAVKETGLNFIGSAVQQNSAVKKILWVIVPLIPLAVMTVNNITGIIFGSCSWGTVNAHVVKALEAQAQTGQVQIQVPEKVDKKDDKKSDKKADRKAEKEAEKAERKAEKERLGREKIEAKNANKTEHPEAPKQRPQPPMRNRPRPNVSQTNIRMKDMNLPSDDDIVITATSDLGPQKITSELKPRCVEFYRQVIDMFGRAKTVYSPIYTLAKQKLDDYQNREKKKNWANELKGIEDTMLKITGKDAKLVLLLQKILKHPRIELFGSDKPLLSKLTNAYISAYQKWNLREVERNIEKIYLITFNYEQLYGKIGYCIRTKLVNNYGPYVRRHDFVARLEEAKDEADYTTYRDICIESITAISSNKDTFRNSIDRYIHN